VRGIVGVDLNTGIVESVANAVVLTGAKCVVFGQDTRESGIKIREIMTKIMQNNGIFTLNLGIIPSASMAFLTPKLGADLGIMITASHNPPEHNGINIYDKHGEILGGMELEKFDSHVDYCISNLTRISKEQINGKIQAWEDYVFQKFEPIFKGKTLPHIAIDFANGSGANVALDVLQRLGFTVDAYHNKPNGNNSNKNCGSQHPEAFKRAISKKPFGVGFAYDGDADRVACFTNKGVLIPSDAIIGVLGLNLGLKQVISTVMMNTGVERYLQSKKIGVTRTNVGERFLIPELKKYKPTEVIGGESSSHFIFPDILLRGDSLITTLKLLQILVQTGKTIEELIKDIPMWFSVLHNTEIDIEGGEKKEKDYRVLIRKSGTEKLTRVFVEATTEQKRDEILAQILQNKHM